MRRDSLEGWAKSGVQSSATSDVMRVKWRDVIAAAAAGSDDDNSARQHNRCGARAHGTALRSSLLARSCENCRPIITVRSANNADRRQPLPSPLWFAAIIVTDDTSPLSPQSSRANTAYHALCRPPPAWHRLTSLQWCYAHLKRSWISDRLLRLINILYFLSKAVVIKLF